MSIRSISNPYGPQRVAAPAAATPAPKDGSASGPAAGTAPRQDSVSISAAGRALSGGSAAATSGSSLTPERVADLRKKVLEGAYNSTHVVNAVASRLLSTGDV
ncbi:hypothetical protein tb265_18160 [Gemmatimonadetes bacterium T265]|nr:hypothetical protein tb265_18160 [Gemmatimonadetes bacterium T265]